MKTKHLVATAFILIVGSLSIDASAQTTLKALVKKCESIESVDMDIIRNRNSETKQMDKADKLSQQLTCRYEEVVLKFPDEYTREAARTLLGIN
jgi:hypothetical protein